MVTAVCPVVERVNINSAHRDMFAVYNNGDIRGWPSSPLVGRRQVEAEGVQKSTGTVVEYA